MALGDRSRTAQAKAGANGADPVKVSDLRAKAQMRDARLVADRGKLFADNNRSGGRKSLAPVDRAAVSNAARAPAKGATGRTTATPRGFNSVANTRPSDSANGRSVTDRSATNRSHDTQNETAVTKLGPP